MSTTDERLHFIDNLRSAVIFLVIAVHTTITYSHIGSWYYEEKNTLDPITSLLFLMFEAHCQAYFMGIMFFLAGYFVPSAFDRKGFCQFSKDRFLRLGVPALFFMVVIQPLVIHFLLHHGDRPFWTYLHTYFTTDRVLNGSGPMWFALALLFFCLCYGLTRLLFPGKSLAIAVPNLPKMLGFAVIIGLITFVVRLVQPIGTNVLNMQLCFFTQYIALFILGIVAYRNHWLANLPERFGLPFLIKATAIGLIVLLGAVLLSPSKTGLSSFAGGWKLESLFYALWEELVCVTFSMGILVVFKKYFNTDGPFAQVLRKSSFGIYFLHTPIVIGGCQSMGWLHLAPLAKAIAFTPMNYFVTLAFVYLVARHIPWFKKML